MDSSPERSAWCKHQLLPLAGQLCVPTHKCVLCLRVAICRVDVARGTEPRLSAQLESVEAQLSLTSPSGLVPRMEALKAASRYDQQEGRPAHFCGSAVLQPWRGS